MVYWAAGCRRQAAGQQNMNNIDQLDGCQRHRGQVYHMIGASASAAGCNRDQVTHIK